MEEFLAKENLYDILRMLPKKTRMRLSPSVPKPENPDGFGGKQNMRK